MGQKVNVTIKFSNEPSTSSIKNLCRVLEDIYNNSKKLLNEEKQKD